MVASNERAAAPKGVRFKNIDLHDSFISIYKGRWLVTLNEIASLARFEGEFNLQPRNPFRRMEPIDYDKDSEEEFNDLNGENLMSEKP
jgi:hypothetical protein